MTMTLDRDTWMAAQPRSDNQVTVWSLHAESGSTFSLSNLQKDQQLPWSNYVRAVAWALQDAGHTLSGFDAVIHSSLPLGSGLSSSAALELVTALMFQHLGGIQMGAVETALLAQRAENEFVGVNCGILDQYSSAMGQAGCALLLDCRDLSSRAVPIAPDLQLVICDTRAPRQLLGSEYDERREQCRLGAEFFQRFAVCATCRSSFLKRTGTACLSWWRGAASLFWKKMCGCGGWLQSCPLASGACSSNSLKRRIWAHAICIRSPYRRWK